MEPLIYRFFTKAKENKDLKTMKSLHNGYPNDSTIAFEYAKMLKEAGWEAEAKKIFLKLLKTRNADYAMFELGKLEFEHKNLEKAKQYLEPLARKRDLYAVYLLGEVAKEEGNYNLARKYFNILLVQKFSLSRLAMGKLELKLGNIDKARDYFKSYERSAHDFQGVLERGRLEAAIDNYNIAKQMFTSLLQTEKKSAAIVEFGKLEYSRGNISKAKEYFKKLIDTPEERFAYRLLTIMAIKQEEYIEAFNWIREALQKGCDFNPDILMFISTKLNVILPIDYEKYKYSYTMNQEIKYDESAALNHIIDGHVKQSRDFKNGINIYKLYCDVKCNLDEKYKVTKLHFNDTYILPYKGIGNNRDYLKVITLPNSEDIITMFPVASKFENIEKDIDLVNIDLTKSRKML